MKLSLLQEELVCRFSVKSVCFAFRVSQSNKIPSNISNMGNSVSSDVQTSRSRLKNGVAESFLTQRFFNPSLRYLGT